MKLECPYCQNILDLAPVRQYGDEWVALPGELPKEGEFVIVCDEDSDHPYSVQQYIVSSWTNQASPCKWKRFLT